MTDRTQDKGAFPIAFAGEDGNVVVNFGVLTGREATQAELDRLAHSLRRAGAAPEMTVTASRRQDYGREVEAVVHQVHVEAVGLPVTDFENLCTEWAVDCAEDRTVEPLG
ncbi:MAG TPA: hypothetical protein VEW90_04975 [Gaiellaceae bacterium]|nr:hypothetical protein [Gaiellaceae bacterium]